MLILYGVGKEVGSRLVRFNYIEVGSSNSPHLCGNILLGNYFSLVICTTMRRRRCGMVQSRRGTGDGERLRMTDCFSFLFGGPRSWFVDFFGLGRGRARVAR